MRVKIIDNESGDEQIVEVEGYEMLIGSDSKCDVVLKKRSSASAAEIFGQHALFARIGHHIYLRRKRDEMGVIKSFYQEEPNEFGYFTNWDDSDIRIDANAFEIGQYTICAFR